MRILQALPNRHYSAQRVLDVRAVTHRPVFSALPAPTRSAVPWIRAERQGAGGESTLIRAIGWAPVAPNVVGVPGFCIESSAIVPALFNA